MKRRFLSLEVFSRVEFKDVCIGYEDGSILLLATFVDLERKKGREEGREGERVINAVGSHVQQ